MRTRVGGKGGTRWQEGTGSRIALGGMALESVLSDGGAASECTLGRVQDMLMETTTHEGGWSGNQLLWDLEIFFSMKTSSQKSDFLLRPWRHGGFPFSPCVLGLSPLTC